jgi:hypothetical protein
VRSSSVRRHGVGAHRQDANSRPGRPALDGAARMPPPRYRGSEPRADQLGQDAPPPLWVRSGTGRPRRGRAVQDRERSVRQAGRARGAAEAWAVVSGTGQGGALVRHFGV